MFEQQLLGRRAIQKQEVGVTDAVLVDGSSGTKGRNKGEFTNLQGVAASSCGRILIADSNNQCVQVRDRGTLVFGAFFLLSHTSGPHSRSSPTRVNSKTALGFVGAHRGNCSGPRVWLCTPAATSSSPTTTISGLASFPAKANSRFVHTLIS